MFRGLDRRRVQVQAAGSGDWFRGLVQGAGGLDRRTGSGGLVQGAGSGGWIRGLVQGPGIPHTDTNL